MIYALAGIIALLVGFIFVLLVSRLCECDCDLNSL